MAQAAEALHPERSQFHGLVLRTLRTIPVEYFGEYSSLAPNPRFAFIEALRERMNPFREVGEGEENPYDPGQVPMGGIRVFCDDLELKPRLEQLEQAVQKTAEFRVLDLASVISPLSLRPPQERMSLLESIANGRFTSRLRRSISGVESMELTEEDSNH